MSELEEIRRHANAERLPQGVDLVDLVQRILSCAGRHGGLSGASCASAAQLLRHASAQIHAGQALTRNAHPPTAGAPEIWP